MKCGLLGRKLGHSYSPQIHASMCSYSYDLFEKEPEELESFLRSGEIHGLNVTIPYKKQVIPFCQDLSPRAKKLGAVNTIVRREDGSLIGHNTDYFGFETMLSSTGLSVSGKKVLVLGSGGASATAVAVLKDHGANVVVISRTGENNYQNLYLHKDCSVVVNTTPVGMYPNVSDAPIDLTIFDHLTGVLDVIYNPARTSLLLQAEKMGLKTANGLLMLVAQAKESAEWFSGHSLDDSLISTVYRSLKKQMENIILIGMPGCGKSTVGQKLAEKTHLKFVDADAEFTDRYGVSPAEVILQDGEDSFRKMETTVLESLGKESGLVIATGGGCVTRKENYDHLHRNGMIYYLQRDISLLPTKGRPLSQQNSLEEMFHIRHPLYLSFADQCIDNTGTIDQTVNKILESR